MSRLLFDVTRLVQSGLHTGIQRVVRSLLAASQRQLGSSGHSVLPVVFREDRWYALSFLAPHPLQALGSQSQPSGEQIQPGQGDILLLFDASWYCDPWPAVDAALARGARLCGMVHDLLPMQRSSWFRCGLQDSFSAHLHALAARAEHLFVPSRTVRDRLHQELSQPGLVVSVLPHGGDFCQRLPTANAPSSLPLPLTFTQAPFYFVLGTLEPRKNHKLVLDAFDVLWSQGSDAKLVFAGSVGWQVDELLARVQTHSLLNLQLFHVANLDDPTLLWLFRNAAALLYMSMDEGFGLPVLEAAMQNCPVIAADIAVLREAGGSWPRYVMPTDLSGLVQALASPKGAQDQSPPHRSWDQVALQLGALLKLNSSTEHHDLPTL